MDKTDTSISVDLPDWAKDTLNASNVRSIEDSEIPQYLCFRRFASDLGWRHVENTNDVWRSVPPSTKGKLPSTISDVLVEALSINSVRPEEASEQWIDAYETAFSTNQRVLFQSEIESYGQRYLQHHAYVAECREKSSDKGHREATPQEVGLKPDPIRVGVVIVGEDQPREFSGNPIEFLYDIAHKSDDHLLWEQYRAAKREEKIRSVPFIRALNVPCIVLSDRLEKEYELFVNRVIDYHGQ
jgi:hypothetical protein